MSDLNEQAKERKRSDTSLINFMQNHKVSVRLISPNWVATTEYHMGMGKDIRSAVANLERSMYGR